MRRLSSLFVLLLLGGILPARAAEEPRALIERAVKAMGGADKVKQRVAIRMKMKGEMYAQNGERLATLVGELWEFSTRSKLVFEFDVSAGGQRVLVNKVTVVVNGDKSWTGMGGQVGDFSKADLDSQRTLRHQDRVTNLTALLTDKGFTFASLDDVKVDGRPARGIKVSYNGEADTRLYFDQKSGLLVKYAYRAKKSRDLKEVLHEAILSDYREPDLASADVRILRAAKIDASDATLLAFVCQQTPSRAALERVRALVRQLGDEAFQERERASADLMALGAIALPLLREATKDADREVARRARDCLQRIGEVRSQTRISAAIRLLGLRKPAGTAEALLNYLPVADAEVANEVRAALFAVAQQDGKQDPALLRALDDKDAARRKAAEAALGKDGGAYAKQPDRRLFLRPPKIAMKYKSWVDGKRDIEMETSDYQFFNAFEDKVFAKP